MSETLLQQEKRYLGASVAPIDGAEKVTGKAVYSIDLAFPRMLVARVKRSPYAHARIVDIDTEAASKLAGVKAIVRGEDLPDRLTGKGIKDTPILARGKVRYLGEPVVAVAAESEAIALKALDMIRVRYEELPAIFDPIESASQRPPIVVHEKLGSYATSKEGPYRIFLDPSRPNVNCYTRVINGDVGEGFREAPIVIENEYRTQRVHHYHTELPAFVAMKEGDGSVKIYSGSQSLYKIRAEVAEVLALPEHHVKVVALNHVGGGFGNRNAGYHEAICAALALRTDRPVKMTMTREEVMTATTTRHSAVVRIKDGVTKDGLLIAREITVFLAGGAYSMEGISAVRNSVSAACSTYYVPNFRMETFRTYTNEVEGGAMRAFGYPYVLFAIESQMDLIAERTGVSPVEVRLKNLLPKGQKSVSGELIDKGSVRDCLARALAEADKPTMAADGGNWHRGRGIAIGHKGVMGNFPTVAYVQYRHDDVIEVRAGVFDIGQGTRTGLLQVVAAEFNHPLDLIRFSDADSELAPVSGGATGSRQTFHLGNALVRACAACKKQILEAASNALGVPAERLEVGDRAIRDARTHSALMPISDLFIRGPAGGGFVQGLGEFMGKGVFFVPTGNIDPSVGKATGPRSLLFYTPVAVVADVLVNVETGQVKVAGVSVALDAGLAINPKMIEGQSEGCVVQGIGMSLSEELVLERGKVVNADNKDYKIPSIGDAPLSIRTAILENPVEDAALGVRGCGEAPLAVIPAAIANAVCGAIGARIYSLPYTGERVLAAVRK